MRTKNTPDLTASWQKNIFFFIKYLAENNRHVISKLFPSWQNDKVSNACDSKYIFTNLMNKIQH